jgi:hypothetical protein
MVVRGGEAAGDEDVLVEILRDVVGDQIEDDPRSSRSLMGSAFGTSDQIVGLFGEPHLIEVEQRLHLVRDG